jgi:hypothetical protein
MKMRIYINLILLLLCLSGTLYAQSPVLETKVSLQYREMEIGKILKDLNKRYKLNFSYSNNIVPEKKKVSVSMKNVMLKDALKDLFKETDVAFQVVGEQIVLKKGIKKTSSRLEKYRVVNVVSVPPVLYDPSVSHDDLIVSNNEDFIVDTMPDDELGMEAPLLIEDNYQPSRKDLRRKYKGERKLLKARFYILKDSLRRKGSSNTMVNLQMKYNYIAQKMKQEFNQLRNPGIRDTVAPVTSPNDSSKKTAPVVLEEKKDYLYRPFQISFISPLGTNGHDCGKTVNNLSFNMIGGYAAGLEGLELGGVANIEKDYMHGIQMAGVANVVKNKAEGIQLSGFANICGDTTKALQAAGFCNVVNGSFYGMQNAGFCNVDKGSVKGFQGAGFINVMQDSLNGIQIAGFANLNNGDVNGIQAAGFLNTAKKVKGVQLGVINIADSIQGVPIGLLSIVKKGGYRRVDLFATEALYANVAFKIGVRQLYNIFTGGVQFKDSKMRLAAGCGIGTEAKIGNRGFANLETVTMYVWEQDMVAPKLNMLNKLSSTVGVRLGKRTSIYAGPSLNVMLSQYQDPDKSTLGSDLAPYSLYNHTFNSNSSPKDDLNLKIWLGVTAGVRF